MKVYSITYKDTYSKTNYIVAAESEASALAIAFSNECGTFLDGTPCKPRLSDFSQPTEIIGVYARTSGIKSKLN